MANSDINMERFAYDVCVHVLEKFGIFKAPDDTRKQNKYTSYDFLSSVSRLVVSYSIWIRDHFKKALEDKYKSANPTDKQKMWNFFDDYLLQNELFVGKDCIGKVCISLALCTEYIQFVSTKDFTVSLNKIVIRWGDFFEKYLRVNFDAEGGFSNLHSNIESCEVDQLDNFHKTFISEYCLPYGVKECIIELAKKCAEKHGIQLDVILGFNKTDIEDLSVRMSDESAAKCSEESPSNLEHARKPGETRSETSDSESSSSNTEASEKTDSEISQNVGSEASDSEMSRNNLLGIPPHEEMLREIDPFFVENIPSPPKPRSASKSPERQPSSDSSKSLEGQIGLNDGPRSASKSEDESCSNDVPQSSSEHQSGLSDVPRLASKSLEIELGSSDVPQSASKSLGGELGSNDAPESASKSLEDEPSSSNSSRSASKSQESQPDGSVTPESSSKYPEGFRSVSKCPERQPDSDVTPESSSKPPQGEVGSSDNNRSSEPEEFQEKMEHILSMLEQNMEALRALLFQRGLILIKSNRQKVVEEEAGCK